MNATQNTEPPLGHAAGTASARAGHHLRRSRGLCPGDVRAPGLRESWGSHVRHRSGARHGDRGRGGAGGWGVVTHELGVIDAVGARVSPGQLEGLRLAAGIRRVYGDAPVATAGCGVVAWASPVPNDKKLEWELTNHSMSTVTLSRVEVQWPREHEGLKKAEFAKEKLIDGDPAPAPSRRPRSGRPGGRSAAGVRRDGDARARVRREERGALVGVLGPGGVCQRLRGGGRRRRRGP